MPSHYKVITLTIFFILLTACGSIEPTSIANPIPTPQVIYVTATQRVVEITATLEPTAPPLSPTSEPAVGSLSFIDSGQRLGAANSWDVALGDLDGDGDLDAFVANSAQGKAKNAVWINDGQGSFTRSEQTPGYGQGVTLGDLDDDGDLDAVVTHWSENKNSAIWLNDGSGNFAESGQNLGLAFRPALGDLDDDGDIDIFLAQIEANTVWLNDGRGIFRDSGQRLGTAITAAVALADLDGDGDLDALAGGWEEPAKVWLNDGTGEFAVHEQTLSPASVHIHDLALGDVDGDSDLDVFTAVASGDPNQVWFNDGSGAFTDSGQQLHSSLAHGVALGDLDRDGDLDALTAHGDRWNGPSGTKIWLNDGTGHFGESELNLGDLYSVNAALGDLDGDNDLDIFIALGETWQENGGELSNEVWLNETITTAASASSAPLQPPFDGSGLIAFYSERDGNAEIYTIKPDGSELQRLTANRAEDICPTISYDGTKIAFNSDRSGNHEIYVMNSNGSNPIRLTNTLEGEYQPEWSPDDNYIVFTQYDCPAWDCGDIFVINADGDNMHQLTNNPADETRPVWSPDGAKIWFNSNRDGNYEIYTMDPDGSHQQRLTNTPQADMFPRLSPDGTKIVYTLVDFQTFAAEVHVMNVDGTNDTTLTSDGRINEDPIWSPDGGKIVFQSDRDGNYEIYIMNTDGSDQQQLTNDRAGDYWPTWGP